MIYYKSYRIVDRKFRGIVIDRNFNMIKNWLEGRCDY